MSANTCESRVGGMTGEKQAVSALSCGEGMIEMREARG